MKAFMNINPISSLVYFICVIMICMFLSEPVLDIIALTGGILFSFMLTKRQEKISDIKFYIPLFVLISITNPLFSHNGTTPLFFMNGNAVTFEAIVYGMMLGVMIISVMLWFKCFSIIMTSDKIIYLFGRAMPKISLVISVTLRYIPMLKRKSYEVKRAQKAMGYYSSESYFDRIRSAVRVLSALIGWSVENAVETAKSMKARGYELKGHTHYHDYKIRKSDAVFLAVSVVMTCIVIWGYKAGNMEFSYYPQIGSITFSAASMAAYIAFAVLAYMPFAIELEENFRWNYYKSKI